MQFLYTACTEHGLHGEMSTLIFSASTSLRSLSCLIAASTAACI